MQHHNQSGLCLVRLLFTAIAFIVCSSLSAVAAAGDFEALRERAEQLYASGSYVEAEAAAKQLLALAEQFYGRGSEPAAGALERLGTCLFKQKRYDEAGPLFRRAIDLHIAVLGHQDPHVAKSIDWLAKTYWEQGRKDEAKKLWKEGLAALPPPAAMPKIVEEEAQTLERRAAGLSEGGRLQEAEAALRQANAKLETQSGPDSAPASMQRQNLADFLFRQGRDKEAFTVLEPAVRALRRNPGQDLIAATSLTRFARLYAQHGRPDAESELLGLAAAIRENTLGSWHPETIAGLTDLGRALERQGRIADALIAFRKAAIATSEWLALASSDVTPVQNASGVFHDVIRSAHAAARLHPQLAAALSEETFQWAQWMAQTSASAALGQMAARFSVGASAFAQQIRELQDRQRDYQVLDRQLIQALGSPTGQSDQAVEMLRAKLVKAEKRIAELTASISLANPNYADFANARPISLQTAQRLLGANEALVFLLIPASKSAGPLDAYGWLTTQDNSRWLRLSIGGPDITADVQALRCGLDRSNWREGSKFREICKTLLGTEPANDQPPLFDAAAAHALYRELFGGVEDLIKDKSLLIVPSGPLTQLPFETLVTEKPDGTLPRFEAYKKAAWLGQRQAITILPSVGSLKALRTAKASAAAAPFIGFGNPLLDGRNRNDKSAWAKQTCAKPSGRERSRTADRAADIASLLREGQVNVESLRHQPPLPETADELCAVAKTLGVPEARLDDAVYLGERATVSQVKAKSKSGELARARVVHFATHGLLAGQTAMFAQNKAEPALLLTPPATASEEDNGLLTASEVAQLNLNADWVVMSACNTAAGSNEGAEALSGLARAFFYAGARSLLVSHWAVDSEAAVAITTGAVNAMKAEPRIGRAEALRRSIAALIAKGGNNAHPSVWAPFVLVGNGEQ